MSLQSCCGGIFFSKNDFKRLAEFKRVKRNKNQSVKVC